MANRWRHSILIGVLAVAAALLLVLLLIQPSNPFLRSPCQSWDDSQAEAVISSVISGMVLYSMDSKRDMHPVTTENIDTYHKDRGYNSLALARECGKVLVSREFLLGTNTVQCVVIYEFDGKLVAGFADGTSRVVENSDLPDWVHNREYIELD